jgi:Tfp pilus assembly protein FimT
MRHSMLIRGQRGYSLVEAVLVVAVLMILASASIINIRAALRTSEMDRAYDLTLTQMRQARQSAIAERRIYRLAFTSPRFLEVKRVEKDSSRTLMGQFTLPGTVVFQAEPGIPTGASKTPDQFGTGSVAIDFNNGGGVIYFQPDGSARDEGGRTASGVIYLARPGDLPQSRAVTLFGTTGRIKGWRLTRRAGEWAWY